MTHHFDENVVAAVLRHMNGDHTDDNLLISRAFGPSDDVVEATMVGFDGDQGVWRIRLADGTESDLAVAWPAAPITERVQVRHQIVALYDAACRRRGIDPRPHS